MSFFIRKPKRGLDAKRKKGQKKQGSEKIKKKKQNNGLEEVLSSEEEHSGIEDYTKSFSSDEETEQEKRLRLAKKYLDQVEEEERNKNLTDDTRDAISQRLKEEALEQAGRLQKKRAHEYENCVPNIFCQFRGHRLSVTCLAVSQSEKFLYSGSKDGSIIKWNIEEKKKVKIIPGGRKGTEEYVGHTDHVLAVTLSSDDKFLATGGKDKVVHIWKPETMELIKTFRGHKKEITALIFQKDSHQLVSASNDRCLKLWNLDEMGYVETLFGHKNDITGIDCFLNGNVITSGRDSNVHVWKIVEESQLLFHAYGASIDCLCVSSHQSFVTGSDDGSLLLWGVNKRKPMSKIPAAHGCFEESDEPHWITSLCALQNTDLIASGSSDGIIRLWKRDDDNRSLSVVSKISTIGFVNSLSFSKSGKYLIAGIGQEHRFGRWRRIKEARNSIVIYSFEQR